MSDKLCAYVEFVLGYENNILEFPCTNERKHGLFCEEHKEWNNPDYDPQKDTVLDKSELKEGDRQ